MNWAAIGAGILGLLKALPGIVALLERLEKKREQAKDIKIEQHYESKNEYIRKVNAKIEKAKTDEERKELLAKLYTVNPN